MSAAHQDTAPPTHPRAGPSGKPRSIRRPRNASDDPAPPKTARFPKRLFSLMAWSCSGTSNAELVHNLFRAGIITSPRVRDAMLSVDRADFTPARGNPYADAPQPLSHGATISAPHMHAHALTHLLPSLQPGARVLDVGSGSGYLTAVLGALVGEGGKAVGLEHVGALVRGAEASVRKSEMGRKMVEEGRVRFVVGDGRVGLQEEEGWDAIHVGAAAERVHEELVEQLREGGRMFIPVGGKWEEQSIWLVSRVGGEVKRERLFGVVYVPLTDPPPNSE